MSGYTGFVDLKYKPTRDDLICSFYLEPAQNVSMKVAAGAVAGESSIGTWTDVSTMKKHIDEIKARVFSIKGKYIKIAYPGILFEPGNVPQILSSVAGNVFGMKAAKNLRLIDIQWPEKIMSSFKGPKFGIKGIRKIFKVNKRPITASVPKPKIGMTTAEFGKVAYDIWSGGLDLVKDDENLTSQSFNKFEKRLRNVMKIRDKVENESGDRKSYLCNITAETKEMEKRAKLIADYDNEYAMVDIITTGWAGVQTARDFCGDLGLAIHAHRAMHAAFDRNLKHGMSMVIISDLARLIGVDQIHIGTIIGKLEGPKKEVLRLGDNCREQILKEESPYLPENWRNKKQVFPVSSGGLHPGIVPDIIRMLGNDIIIQAGGGVHGHPKGTKAGAKALMQAIQASIEGLSLEEKANKNKESAQALEKWHSKKWK